MVGRELKPFLRRALLFANVTMGVVGALFCLAAWLAPESLSAPSNGEPGVFRIDVRGGHGAGLVAIGAALLLTLDVLWLVYGGTPKEPSDHVVSKTVGGPVKVSRDALESGLPTLYQTVQPSDRQEAFAVDANGILDLAAPEDHLRAFARLEAIVMKTDGFSLPLAANS